MRRLFGLGSVMALASAIALVAACGDGGPESMVEDGGVTAGSGSSSGSGSGGSSSGTFALGGTSASMAGTGNASGDGPVEACAAANQQAELAPVYLVFLLDQSGSMGDGKYGERTEKWDPVTAALKAFFADQASSGIVASLSLFPLDKNKTTGAASSSTPPDCNADAYFDPAVQPTALPNAESFANAIAAIDPPNEFGTPTHPALAGTVDYAESLLTEDATRKVAIVMVTDGNPTECQGNNIENTASAAAAVADRIPTYVIGVGESLDALNAIAVGGGTEEAFMVSIDEPEKTRTELLNAINLIRGRAISCEIDIPAPPSGKKLDPEKVNVEFTPDGQAPASLKYGTECVGDTAWRYDDAAAPKKIQLCDSTCEAVKADGKGKLDVVFGCVKRDVVN